MAVQLMASVDGQSDEDAESAWAAEIERRARNAHSGASHGEDIDDVLREIERGLNQG